MAVYDYETEQDKPLWPTARALRLMDLIDFTGGVAKNMASGGDDLVQEIYDWLEGEDG